MIEPSIVADRVERFRDRFGMTVPICEAPMAGSSSIARAAAVADAGGMAGFGAYLTPGEGIERWVASLRGAASDPPLQINLWVPSPVPVPDGPREAAMRRYLERWGAAPSATGDAPALPDFDRQCAAVLTARPKAVSSTMGLFAPPFVRALKAAGIAWFATVTTLGEARAAAEEGADALIAQGMEAGGHRGTFNPDAPAWVGIGLMSLVPQLADRTGLPVIAAGGIADGRGIAAALMLGASAVQIGTALLRTPESDTPVAWSDALAKSAPEDTVVTRAFTGRPGRAIANAFAAAPDMPEPLAFPTQRALTAALRASPDPRTMQHWAGQSAAMADAVPTSILMRRWTDQLCAAGPWADPRMTSPNG